MNRLNITSKIWLSVGVFVVGFVVATALDRSRATAPRISCDSPRRRSFGRPAEPGIGSRISAGSKGLGRCGCGPGRLGSGSGCGGWQGCTAGIAGDRRDHRVTEGARRRGGEAHSVDATIFDRRGLDVWHDAEESGSDDAGNAGTYAGSGQQQRLDQVRFTVAQRRLLGRFAPAVGDRATKFQ